MAVHEMTPLIKGYLRLGARFGRGVFVDAPFNSYDVFVLLKTRDIKPAYQKHFLGRENALAGMADPTAGGAMRTIGKIVTFPVTGPLKAMGAFVEFLLREDAVDAEYRDDSKDMAEGEN